MRAQGEFPLVSIVTPSYNQGRFIEETLLSVKNQDYPSIEHIIVDGGSTDNTLEILKKYEGSYSMRWVSEPDRGQSDAVNKGFRMANGEIVGWLNSDDCYFDICTISNVKEYFHKYEDADVVYGDAVRIDEDNLMLYIIKVRNFNYSYLKKACFIVQPAAFFRRDVIDNFELDVNLGIPMDYDFWLRTARKHKFQRVNEILAVDRTHKGRKLSTKKDDWVREATHVSEQWRQFNLQDRICSYGSYGVRSLQALIILKRLYRRGYNFAFNMRLGNVVSTIFRQLDPRK